MDNNIDFRELWAGQSSTPPGQEELFGKIKKLKNDHLRKLVISNVLLIATAVFIIFITYASHPALMSTWLGTGLVLMAMAIFLAVYNGLIPLLKKINDQQSNAEYLAALVQLKSKQRFLETTMMNIYFVMLSLGIGFYMYEFTARGSGLFIAITYGLTFGWIGFAWFYLRPRSMTKQQQKLNELISDIERMKQQLEEE